MRYGILFVNVVTKSLTTCWQSNALDAATSRPLVISKKKVDVKLAVIFHFTFLLCSQFRFGQDACPLLLKFRQTCVHCGRSGKTEGKFNSVISTDSLASPSSWKSSAVFSILRRINLLCWGKRAHCMSIIANWSLERSRDPCNLSKWNWNHMMWHKLASTDNFSVVASTGAKTWEF